MGRLKKERLGRDLEERETMKEKEGIWDIETCLREIRDRDLGEAWE